MAAQRSYEITEAIDKNEFVVISEQRRHPKVSKILFKIAEWCKPLLNFDCWVAGGFIRDVWVGDEPRDMDVYFADQEVRSAAITYLERMGWVIEKSGPVVTTLVCEIGRPIQLICFHDDSPKQSVERFDFHACSAALDLLTEHFCCTAGFLSDIEQKRITLNCPWYPQDSLRRVERFSNRGWLITEGTEEALETMDLQGKNCRLPSVKQRMDYLFH